MTSKSSRGFTLIELMIVVAIIGILAVIAFVAYSRFVASARKSEVHAMFAEIRAKEEAYRAEFSVYLSSSPGELSMWPAAGGAGPKQWAPPPWSWPTLNVAPPKQQVNCSYSVVAGPPGQANGVGPLGRMVLANYGNPPAMPTAWWYAVARCDNDNNAAVDSYYVARSDTTVMVEGCAGAAHNWISTGPCTQ